MALMEDVPAKQPWGSRGRARLVRASFTLLAVGLSGWLLWRQLSDMSFDAFLGALKATAPLAVLLSVGFTGASYACLAGTEWLALRALGFPLGYRAALAVAAPSYALTNSAGFSPATGTLIRVRLYASHGLSPGAAARVSFVAGAAVTLSGVVTAGLLMLLAPHRLSQAAQSPVWAVVTLAVTMILPAGLWFVAFIPAAPPWLGGRRNGPDGRTRAVGLLAGLGDWVFSCAALFVLLPGPGLADYPPFLAAYVAGSLLSAATGAPGGLGVFEAIFLALVSALSQVHETAAALLLYRGVYSLGPLALWGVASALHRVHPSAFQGRGPR